MVFSLAETCGAMDGYVIKIRSSWVYMRMFMGEKVG